MADRRGRSLDAAILLNLDDRVGTRRKLVDTDASVRVGKDLDVQRGAKQLELPVRDARLARVADAVTIEVIVLHEANGSRLTGTADITDQTEAVDGGVVLNHDAELAVLKPREQVADAGAVGVQVGEIQRDGLRTTIPGRIGCKVVQRVAPNDRSAVEEVQRIGLTRGSASTDRVQSDDQFRTHDDAALGDVEIYGLEEKGVTSVAIVIDERGSVVGVDELRRGSRRVVVPRIEFVGLSYAQ